LKQQCLTKEVEAKRLANESARREEARIQKEIEEKELEEVRAFLVEAEKRKGKKGKKAIGDGVSSFYNWFSFLWMFMIAGLWHVLIFPPF
jgi:translation initiation factor 3 subunit A